MTISLAPFTIWSTSDRSRYFLVPDDRVLPAGDLRIHTFGRDQSVDREAVVPFEVTSEQAAAWTSLEFRRFLGQAREGIDEKLREWRRDLDERKSSPPSDEAPYTSDAPPALLELVKQLPGVVGKGLSGEDERVKAARDAMAELQGRLKDAGIDVGDALARFPDRLAELRREFERKGEDAPDER